MPLTSKGNTILDSMQKQYGEKKGKQVFYASANAGKITGVEPKAGILRRKKGKKLTNGMIPATQGGDVGGR